MKPAVILLVSLVLAVVLSPTADFLTILIYFALIAAVLFLGSFLFVLWRKKKH